MAISSNALFHYCGKFEDLKDILQNKSFKPKYCLEYDKGKIEGDRFYALPMVCFCDIPLSQIREHIKDYGHYAIGLSKKWARNKLSPMVYYKEKDAIARALYDYIISKSIDQSDLKQALLYFSLLKRYYGETWSASKKKESGNKSKSDGYRHKVLYNEREWRYIPRRMGIEDFVQKVKSYKELSVYQQKKVLESHKLKFAIKDIKFMIVKDESDRLPLIKHIVKTIILPKFQTTAMSNKSRKL